MPDFVVKVIDEVFSNIRESMDLLKIAGIKNPVNLIMVTFILTFDFLISH